jgi:hypothetical protein
MTAATQNMPRQPSQAPTNPLSVLDSRIPISSPLMIDPITLPVLDGSDRWAARGRINWGMTDVAPISTLAISRHSRLGESAANTRAATAKAAIQTIWPRRSTLSPNGTKKRSPSAYPAWVRKAMRPPLPGSMAKLLLINTRSG